MMGVGRCFLTRAEDDVVWVHRLDCRSVESTLNPEVGRLQNRNIPQYFRTVNVEYLLPCVFFRE